MKLQTLFNQPFSIEMDGQETITGTIRDLDKKETKEFEKTIKQLNNKRKEITRKQSEFQLLADKIELLKDKKKNNDIIKEIKETFNNVKDLISAKKTLKEIHSIATKNNAISDEIMELSQQLQDMEKNFNSYLEEIEDSTEHEDNAKKYFNMRVSFDTEEMRERTIIECENRSYQFMLKFIQDDAHEKQGNDTLS